EGFLKSGAIELVRSVVRTPVPLPTTTQDLTIDTGTSAFSSIDFSKIPPATPQTPSNIIGPCIVNTLPPPPQANTPNDSVSYLDAGSVLTVKGPNGTRTLAKQPAGFSSILGQAPAFPGQPVPQPLYVSPGEYTFDNGSGGKDIGPFKLTFTMVQP